MIKSFVQILILLFIYTGIQAQKVASFKVTIPKDSQGMEVLVSANLDQVTFLADSTLTLSEIEAGKKSPIPFQIVQGSPRTIYWIAKGGKAGESRNYELSTGTSSKFETITSKDENGTLTIRNGDKNFLRYQYATMYPPAGIDSAFKRSGFIHPLWSPNGQVLTRIQAPDHYHHYGIWNPWTEVLFEGDSVDFWNLGRKQGTVRFAGFESITSGPVFTEFKAKHEHVVFKKKSNVKKVAINELQTVRIYKPQHQDFYIADITSELNCASSSPVLLLEYRYGGLGWRATEQWDKNNSEVLTSEGKIRKEADGSTARWCIVQGAVDNDYAGVVMMSYPTNYNHPEPLRIWPENSQNRGDMFANFSPTKNKSWLLKPGKSYVLKYRLLVYNGHMTKEKAEAAWQYFVSQTEPIVSKK